MVARVWNLCSCADLIGYPSRFVLIRSFRWLGRGKSVGDSTIKGSCAGLPSQLRPPGWRRVRGCVKIDFWVRQRSIHAAAAAGVTCLCTLTTRMLGENKMKGNPEKMGTRESRPLQSRAAQVYGLNLVGEFDPVPAIVQSDHGAGGSPVTIRRASLPADVTASLAAGTDVINSPGLSVQRFAGIGTFMVENGTDITIDAAPDVSAHSLKLWLLGPVLAAVLYQRGLVPLHGNGIDLGGSSVIVSGNSGAGKSTFLKSLAGIWPFSSGRIHIPQNTQCLFLPQEPFFPENDILAAACYPFSSDGISHDELYACLERVGLSDLASRMRAGEHPSLTGFSRGERQRLAFVRVLLSRPDWLFLDEATSAVDIETEDRILTDLTQSFPAMTIIIVSHRKPEGLPDLRHLDLINTNEELHIS